MKDISDLSKKLEEAQKNYAIAKIAAASAGIGAGICVAAGFGACFFTFGLGCAVAAGCGAAGAVVALADFTAEMSKMGVTNW